MCPLSNKAASVEDYCVEWEQCVMGVVCENSPTSKSWSMIVKFVFFCFHLQG